MKIMVIGHARHGKDSVCNYLRDIYGLQFCSSSYFVAEKAVIPWLEKKGIVYPDLAACYSDRGNHRADWFDAIAEYNKDDPSRLGKELFAQYDIYCGLRRLEEYIALRQANAFQICFWVDRSFHVKAEPKTSNEMTSFEADVIIDNNGTLEELRGNVIYSMSLAQRLLKKKIAVSL